MVMRKHSALHAAIKHSEQDCFPEGEVTTVWIDVLSCARHKVSTQRLPYLEVSEPDAYLQCSGNQP